MVKAFADSTKIPVSIGMHAPGGVSVGDTAQGTTAHMNNPVLYALIRSKKWDVAVIQDNQGRFVRDSAQFPGSSKVVQGHLKLMDSIRQNNSCAKVLLFAGWGVKTGLPPYGNTGIEMIQRILRNYVVINDTMKEIISPIGDAWIKGINFLPSVDLWSSDQTHPSNEGSYLTAAVIYSTIFNLPCKNLNYQAGISSPTANILRAFADTVVFNPALRIKYNLGGMAKITLSNQTNLLTVPGNHISYKWYKNNQLVGNSSSLALSGLGRYYALVKESNNTFIKTCAYDALSVGMSETLRESEIQVYPNPVNQAYFFLELNSDEKITDLVLSDGSGKVMPLAFYQSENALSCDVSALESGCYLMTINTSKGPLRKKLVVLR